MCFGCQVNSVCVCVCGGGGGERTSWPDKSTAAIVDLFGSSIICEVGIILACRRWVYWWLGGPCQKHAACTRRVQACGREEGVFGCPGTGRTSAGCPITGRQGFLSGPMHLVGPCARQTRGGGAVAPRCTESPAKRKNETRKKKKRKKKKREQQRCKARERPDHGGCRSTSLGSAAVPRTTVASRRS